MDLSSKKMQVFISNARPVQCYITTNEVILQGILILISGFERVHQKDFHTGRSCTLMSSFFSLKGRYMAN